MIDSGSMIHMDIDTEDIIYSPNYNDNIDCGYDIALIGISKENNSKLQKYIDIHEKKI